MTGDNSNSKPLSKVNLSGGFVKIVDLQDAMGADFLNKLQDFTDRIGEDISLQRMFFATSSLPKGGHNSCVISSRYSPERMVNSLRDEFGDGFIYKPMTADEFEEYSNEVTRSYDL